MSESRKVILKRFARGLGAVVAGFVAAFVVSDDVLGIVPDQFDSIVVLVVAPAVLAIEKFLRDGGDANA